MEKFEITDECRIFRGVPGREVQLHRIRALRDIQTTTDDSSEIERQRRAVSDIVRATSPLRGEELEKWLDRFFSTHRFLTEVILAGDLGGWIESEDNLSQTGTCWVGGNAIVTGHAHVSEDAHVFGRAWLDEDAHASGHALVYDQAQLQGEASVDGYARISELAMLDDYAHVGDCATITGRTWLYKKAQVGGIVNVDGFTIVKDDTIFNQIDVPKWHPARVKPAKAQALLI